MATIVPAACARGRHGGDAWQREVRFDIMALAVLGASHHDVTVAQLERLSSGADGIVASLQADPAVSGAVLLSTCNRLEIYLDTALFHDAISAVNSHLAQ